jgi:hypothetical protein
MDPNILYDELIQNAILNPPAEGVYYEKHHIIPKCFGGSNDISNLVKLRARDHFEAHKLLAQMYDEGSQEHYKMVHAYHRMTHPFYKKNIITAEEYEEARILFSKVRKDKKTSDEIKIKMSKSHSGEKNHFYGKSHSVETKAKMSKIRKGKKLSVETKLKMSAAKSGEKHYNFGKSISNEQKQKLSEANKLYHFHKKSANWFKNIEISPTIIQ